LITNLRLQFRFADRLRSDRGQSIVEFAMTLPFILLVTLGVIETSQALMQQHVTTKIAREGSNMISRETRMLDAGNAVRNMSSNPGSFNSNTLVIFSVLMLSNTGSNNGQIVLYQRYQVGNSALGSSRLNGSGTFVAANDYAATNPHNTTSLRVTNAPANLVSVPGGMIYVTEVYTAYSTLTPVRNLGLPIPSVLYSIAYF
jgi:Flp pilus assembly protein TadG